MKKIFLFCMLVTLLQASDSTSLNATIDSLINLPRITLTYDSRTFTNFDHSTGMSSTTTQKRTFMSVENGIQNQRVRGLGSNLTELLEPVPEAREIMGQYRAAQIVGWALIAVGTTVIFASIPSIEQPDGSPDFTGPIVGAVIIASCNIPFFAFHRHPQKAVDRYNQVRTESDQ